MQYMYLLAMSPDSVDDPAAASAGDWDAYTQALAEAGVLRGGAGLQPVHTATTVRVRDGEQLVTDGPFAESKEHVMGFYLVETPDLDTALEWAAKAPNARTGGVEVRPVLRGTADQDAPPPSLAATSS